MSEPALQLEDKDYTITIVPIWPLPPIFQLISVSKENGEETVSSADEVLCARQPASAWLWENFVKLARARSSVANTKRHLDMHNEVVAAVFNKSIVETGDFTLGPITSAQWVYHKMG